MSRSAQRTVACLRPALALACMLGATLAPAPQQVRADGQHSPQAAQEAYATYCGTCHQFDGKGVTGTYPALDASAIVNGDAKLLARLVLDGGFPNNAMPQFRAMLSAAAAAQILSYLRTAWSNKTSPVTPADIAARNEP